MQGEPLILQAAFALPVILALTLFIYLRSERKAVHLMMAALIASILPWLLGIVLRLEGTTQAVREVGLDLDHVTSFWMPAFFAVAMGYFARLRAFENNRAAAAACLVSAPVFSVLYLLEPVQSVYFLDRGAALAGAPTHAWAGPLYWASKAWAVLLNATAFTFLGIAVFRGRTVDERRRAVALVAAAAAPAATHFAFVFSGNPVFEWLTPLALMVTALAVVHGAYRHGLLDGPPLIRTDLIDHLHEGMIVTNETGIVVDLNARAIEALGVERDVSMGASLHELFSLSFGSERAEEVAGSIMALSPADDELSVEVTGFAGNFFELSAGALQSETFLPSGRIVLLRERSEQRRAELMLREHQKRESVGILAAGVAHEVNNPLAYVRANLAHIQEFADQASKVLGERDGLDLEDWQELPDVVVDTIEGLDRIEQIVKNLVRFSGTPDEDFAPVDVANVVGDALKLADLHRTADVRIERRCVAPLPLVSGSENRIVQAVLNLLLNARQVLEGQKDAWIIVETTTERNEVVIRVRDNGPGVAEADVERIFDPFFTTRAPDEGTGLGLAISIDIAREHGGSLVLEKAGFGACFAMRIPFAEAGQGARAESSRHDESTSLT